MGTLTLILLFSDLSCLKYLQRGKKEKPECVYMETFQRVRGDAQLLSEQVIWIRIQF